jgi:hypothetical protein
MKGILFLIIPIFCIAFLSYAEDHEDARRYLRSGESEQLSPGDAVFLFTQDLAELQTFSEAAGYISYEQMSDEDYKRIVEEYIQKAVRKLFQMMETYKNSPITIRGYSIDLPFKVTIDFIVELPDQ